MASKASIDIERQIYDLLAESNRVPFLFVGSGISRRYMGTEGWEDLLKWVCASVGDPMDPFYMYKERASKSSKDKNTLYPQIASMMEDDFLSATKRPEFADFVRNNEAKLGSVPAMKVYIAEHLQKAKPMSKSDELDVLRHAVRHVSGVITTNYDDLMESVFPKYDVYSRQEDLLFSSLSGMGEIYKIHGSMDDPDSMVLDASDYKRFEEQRNYLLAKIFTVFGEYPIVFLGYSLGDQDIKELLSSIASCAGAEKTREMARRFIFVQYSDDAACVPSIGDYVQSLGEKQSISMTRVTTHDFTPIYRAIAKTNQRYAPRVLSQLSKQLFRSNDTGEDAEEVVFTDFERLDELPQDRLVVVGLSTDEYGKPISADELYEDAVLDDKEFKATLIVRDYLEKFLSGNPSGLPMFKYLSRYAGKVTSPIILAEMETRKTGGFDSYVNPTQRKQKANRRKRVRDRSVQGLISMFGEDKAYKKLTCLEEREISLPDLEAYLKRLLNGLTSTHAGHKRLDPELRRGIRIFDFLKYGKGYMEKL